MSDIRRQELHCHACDRYVQFDVDIELNGNHVLNCPNCGHEHCRVVRDGKITGDRWGQRNGPTLMVLTATATSSATSTYTTYSSVTTGNVFLYGSWINTTATS